MLQLSFSELKIIFIFQPTTNLLHQLVSSLGLGFCLGHVRAEVKCPLILKPSFTTSSCKSRMEVSKKAINWSKNEKVCALFIKNTKIFVLVTPTSIGH